MRRAVLSIRLAVGLAATLALGGCVVAPPTEPSVMGLPGQGKNLDAFLQDDAMCRQYAAGQTGGASPAVAATNSAVGSAVVGTALGAAAGAALGSLGGAAGAGAVIGGVTGLAAGSAIGAGNAEASAGGLQRRYDIAYSQCLYAQGDSVQAAPAGYAAYGYGGYPGPYYGYGPAWFGPSIAIGVGGGWGWGHHWHHWR